MGEYKPVTEDSQCIFCEIAAGRIGSFYWEDEKHVAFLSIDPNTPGFSCVIPKKHFASDVMKMPDAELQEFILAAKQVAKRLENFYPDVGRVGLIMEGTGINHAHIKLVPMHGTEHMKKGEWKQYLSNVEHWFDKYEGWISSAGGKVANQEELAKLSADLKKFAESNK